jgi:hypothetical protein
MALRQAVLDAHPAQDEGPHQHQEGDEARHRVAGQADEVGAAAAGGVVHAAEGHRLAGLHGDQPQVELAFGLHRGLDVVFLAHRHAAAGDDEVVAAGGARRAARVASRLSGTMPRSHTWQPRASSRPRST